MIAERCMCGATDCSICGPLQGYSKSYKPSARDRELALENVVETVMDYGMWPRPVKGGKSEFDLYDFLLEKRDPSYFLEMYLASMSSNTRAFEDRIEREHKTVAAMLEKHFRDSEIVEGLAVEYANEQEAA